MPRRFIARTCFVLLVFAATVLPQAKQDKTNADAPISQKLKAIEQTWLNAEKSHDAATFQKIVADDWMAITPDGKRQTKAERSAEINTTHIVSAELGDLQVRLFGDTAIVTGTDDEVSLQVGKKVTGHYAWTDVFVKRNGKWLAVASQTAQIK